MKLYTTQELNHLYEDETMNLLKNSWNINRDEKIEVYGKFQSHSTSSNAYYCSLIEVKTLSHHQIEYPLVNNIYTIKDRGIYIAYDKCQKLSKQLQDNEELYIKCILQFANREEREKQNNPLLLSVDIDSIQEYKKIKKIIPIVDGDNLLIEKNIVEDYILKNRNILDNEMKKLENSFEKEKKNLNNQIIDIDHTL